MFHRPPEPPRNRAVWVIGTFDTKAVELAFIAERIASQGLAVVTADVSTTDPDRRTAPIVAAASISVGAREIARCHPGGETAVFTGERGSAVRAMAEALTAFLSSRDDIAGLITAGGSGAAALVSPAMREQPVGLPKLIVSTLASGDVRPYVGSADITMMYPVVDVAGINRISRRVLANAAHAIAGMARASMSDAAQASDASDDRPALGLSMFGVTTPCVQNVASALADTFDCLVFHATGLGGQGLERLASQGQLAAMVDISTTEIADHLCGGVLDAGADRLDAPARHALPWIGSCGALDMVNFWGMGSVPQHYRDRLLHVHNDNVTLMRTTPDENQRIGSWIAEKLNRMQGPVCLLIPEGGVSALDAPGQAFWWPQADRALFDALQNGVIQTPQRRLVYVPAHINDPAFAARIVQTVRETVQDASLP